MRTGNYVTFGNIFALFSAIAAAIGVYAYRGEWRLLFICLFLFILAHFTP